MKASSATTAKALPRVLVNPTGVSSMLKRNCYSEQTPAPGPGRDERAETTEITRRVARRRARSRVVRGLAGERLSDQRDRVGAAELARRRLRNGAGAEDHDVAGPDV